MQCFVSRRIGAVLMSGYEQENLQFKQRAARGNFEAMWQTATTSVYFAPNSL